MNGLVLCGTGPHYTLAFYALHVADVGRPWDQTLLPSPTCKGEQYNTMHHDTLALQKPWSHTPTHTVHIPQHRHLHTNTHVTNITNGNTSLTVWEKTASISISTLSRALLSVGTSMMVVSFACSPSVFWMWASGNWKWIPNHDADNKFHALTHPSMN